MSWDCTGGWRCVGADNYIVAGDCIEAEGYIVAEGYTVAQGEGCTGVVAGTVREDCTGVEAGTVAEGPLERVLRASGRHWPGTRPCPPCKLQSSAGR